MSWLKRSSIPLALLAIFALALAMRGLAFEWVFQGDVIAFRPADPQYHLRRAFYTFINFPQILLFDPYINYPGGSAVPWPPLYDFIVGAVARLWASDTRGFEVIAAWASPLFASLTVIPFEKLWQYHFDPGDGSADVRVAEL